MNSCFLVLWAKFGAEITDFLIYSRNLDLVVTITKSLLLAKKKGGPYVGHPLNVSHFLLLGLLFSVEPYGTVQQTTELRSSGQQSVWKKPWGQRWEILR